MLLVKSERNPKIKIFELLCLNLVFVCFVSFLSFCFVLVVVVFFSKVSYTTKPVLNGLSFLAQTYFRTIEPATTTCLERPHLSSRRGVVFKTGFNISA